MSSQLGMLLLVSSNFNQALDRVNTEHCIAEPMLKILPGCAGRGLRGGER